MAIPKNKERITITIHKETKQLLDEMKTLLNSSYTYSNVVEISILAYAELLKRRLDKIEKENDYGKN